MVLRLFVLLSPESFKLLPTPGTMNNFYYFQQTDTETENNVKNTKFWALWNDDT